jgi:peroxiredoxin family protein
MEPRLQDPDLPSPLTLLILSGDMEKGLAACNLALAALAAGRPVSLFFTFWGLNLVRRPEARARGSLLQSVMGSLNRDHAGRQRMGRFNLLGAGPWAMARLLRRKGIPALQESLALAHQMGARLVACSATLDLMGYTRESLIPEVDEIAGAAAFLEAAGGGQVITLS